MVHQQKGSWQHKRGRITHFQNTDLSISTPLHLLQVLILPLVWDDLRFYHHLRRHQECLWPSWDHQELRFLLPHHHLTASIHTKVALLVSLACPLRLLQAIPCTTLAPLRRCTTAHHLNS
jgi:hypothetical protein